MGFCLFNNVAIGALHARATHGLERIAVVDFDVHHGNGTQDIFYNDANLFYASTHQFPLYPGTGSISERGIAGNLVNAPLPPGAGGEEFREAFEKIVLPALERFAPQFVLISAGFDAHAADPLASLRLREDDFAWATERLCAVAQRHCQGRVVSALEGGYDLRALASSAAAHVGVLMRESGTEMSGMPAADPSAIDSLSFEAALKELESIVSRLEQGEVDLEDSIVLYERGQALKAHCEKKLKTAESRLEKIVIGARGAERAEPLDLG
jgi:exodeoxyribonuclease VII small subunit